MLSHNYRLPKWQNDFRGQMNVSISDISKNYLFGYINLNDKYIEFRDQ